MAVVRIAGVTLPAEKRIEASLTYIRGIGFSRAQKALSDLGIDSNARTNDLAETDVAKLRNYIEKNYKVEGDLRQEIQQNIKRLKEISSYRGVRHIRGLPARGQRTKTNSRTVRGNVRRTAGSGRKKASEKT